MSKSDLSAPEFVRAMQQQAGADVLLPTEDQSAVIEAAPTPTLVVAGAGSGKTEVMSLRAVYLMYKYGYPSDSILGLTFTRKATANLAERIQRQLQLTENAGLIEGSDSPDTEAKVATYDSFAAEIVREHGLLIGVSPDSRLVTSAEAWQIMDSIIRKYPYKESDYQILTSKSLQTLRKVALNLSANITDHDADSRALAAEWTRLAERVEAANKTFAEQLRVRVALLPIVEEYRNYKIDNNLAEFSDRLADACKIVENFPQVVSDIRSQYNAILLDEFQDTSVSQIRLLSALFHDKAVTAVGDPNQAIYGFRGASAASLAMFEPAFAPNTELTTLQLRKAWRNWPAILDAANEVVKNDPDQRNLREELYNDPNRPGKVDPALATESIELDGLIANPDNPEGSVKYLFAANQHDEFDLIGRIVSKWQQADANQSVAILVRKKDAFQPLDKSLRRYGVTPRIVGNDGLLIHPAVEDVLAVMHVLVDPDHGPSVMRLITNLDLSASDIRALWDWARLLGKQRATAYDPGPESAETTNGQTRVDAGATADEPADADEKEELRVEFMLDALYNLPPEGWVGRNGHQLSANARNRLRILRGRLQAVRPAIDLGITELIAKIIEVFDIDLDILSDPFYNDGQVALDTFIELAADYAQQTPYADLENFIEWLELTLETPDRLDIPDDEIQDSGVSILTVHQAKGLEWDKVVVTGLNEHDFPGDRRTARSFKRRKNETPESDCDTPHPSNWSLDCGYPPLTPDFGWTGDTRGLETFPFNNRSDREMQGRPLLPTLTRFGDQDEEFSKAELETYRMELRLQSLSEERRLAYVAWTRTSNELLLTGSWYKDKSPRLPSRFLVQMLEGAKEGKLKLHAVTADEVAVPGHPEPPEPIVECFQDAAPHEDDIEDAVSFPKLPQDSRSRMNQVASAVRRQAREVEDQVGQGSSADQLLEAAVAELEKHQSEVGSGDSLDYELLLEHIRNAIAREKADETPQMYIDLERLSATSIERFLANPEELAESIRRPVPQEPSKATLIGNAFHHWAEMWCRKAADYDPTVEPESQVPVDDSESVGLSADELLLSQSQRESLARMQQRAIAIFGEVPENVHSTEEAFSYTGGGFPVRGRYDAIFEKDGHFTIIDWKTGTPPSIHKSEFLPAYVSQLEIYKRAFAEEHGLDISDIDAGIVFLGGPDCPLEDRQVSLEELRKIVYGDKEPDFDTRWKKAVEHLK